MFVTMWALQLFMLGFICIGTGVMLGLLIGDYQRDRASARTEPVEFISTAPSFATNRIMLEKALEKSSHAKPPKKVLSEPEKTALEEGIFEERERLKNVLHDFTVQQLVTARAQLDDLELLQTGETAKAMVNYLHSDLGKTIDSLRYLIYNLNPPWFENKTLSELVDEMRVSSNRFIRFVIVTREICAENRFELTKKQKYELYLILQESLQNSLKHSDGPQFHISLDWTNGLVVTTEDNGYGLRMVEQLGSGILSMKARAESIGATFTINAYKIAGTLITVTLPR
jgi:signal transduction histidine kinase